MDGIQKQVHIIAYKML